jgi:hypothetical protein
MFKWLASAEAASALDNTFFIEPVPVVFRVLQHNLRQLPRAQGLNVAIANQSGTLNMYCVGLAERVSETQNGGLQLSISDEAARLGVPGWAMETCSLTRTGFSVPKTLPGAVNSAASVHSGIDQRTMRSSRSIRYR